MRDLRGGCHCGTISYILHWPRGIEQPFRKCQCAFCTKNGPTYTAHPRAALSVTINDPKGLVRYRFGTETADFCFCARCGVMTHAISVIDGCKYGVVNANTLEDVSLPADIAVRNFEDETREARLERRSRTWIPSVEIIGA